MKKKLFVCMVMLMALLVAVCSVAFAEEAEHTHNWTAGKPATCGAAGTEICSGCGAERSVPATGNHSYTAGKPATCGTAGTEICSGCGAEKAVPATGAHTWTAGKPAACDKAGSQICSVCGKEEAVPATGAHTWTAGKPATCDKAGSQICSVCGKEEAVPVTDAHTWTTGKPATCDQAGTKLCSVCGKEEAVAATGKHDYEATKKVSATTTRRGYTVYTCSVCGDSYKGNYKAMKVAATPVPTATPAPAADAELYGSIVTDAEFEPELYEAVIATKAVEGVEAENNLLIITASADETGAYVLRNLHLSLELIAELKADGIEYICFVVGDYELTFPLSTFDSEDLALIASAVEQEVTGYVITVDPTAVNAEGVVGCAVTTALATIDGEDAEITSILADLVLSKGDAEVVVIDNTVHTFAA